MPTAVTASASPGRQLRSFRWPLTRFVLVGLALWGIVGVVHLSLGPLEGSYPRSLVSQRAIWDGWVRFDGGWYLRIAQDGYSYTAGEQSTVAFFPAYPLTVRVVSFLFRDVSLAGVLTTVGAGAAYVAGLWRWCLRRMSPQSAKAAVLLLLCYPYAWFLFGATYGDALFLAAVIGSFSLVEGDRPVLGGLVGVVATAGRPVGMALTFGLAVLVCHQRGVFMPARSVWHRVRRLRWWDGGVLLSAIGLVAWCTYLWRVHGDPLLFSKVQEWWGQPSSPQTWLKVDFFRALGGAEERGYANGLVLQALLSLGAVAMTPAVWRRFGAAYGVYLVAVLGIPLLGSQDFHGLGRYVLAAFPVFALMGERLAEQDRLRRWIVTGGASMLVVFAAGFARGYYLS